MPAMIPAQSQWLRATSLSPGIGVDRANNVINGFVIAQEGPFKDMRGEFDQKALKQITTMINAKSTGLKSRFTHPTLSGDGLGTFLGRVKDARMSSVQTDDGRELMAVRGNLHLDPTSFETPNGNLGKYVMDLAESDPAAFSSSLVLKPNEVMRYDNHKKPQTNPDTGEELPPLWYPLEIHASDVVDTGAAVDAFLSAEGFPDQLVRDGFKLLNSFLPGQPRDVVEARLSSWMKRAMDARYGDSLAEEEQPEAEPETPEDDGPNADDLAVDLRHRERSWQDR